MKRSEIEPELQLQVVRYKIDENYGYETNNATQTCFEPRSAKKCECILEKLDDQVGEACEVLPSGR